MEAFEAPDIREALMAQFAVIAVGAEDDVLVPPPEVMAHAEVDFVPAQRIMNHPVPEKNDAYLERSTFAWIPYSAVEAFLHEDIDRKKKYRIDPAFLPAGSETQWFWPIWLGNMRKAVLTNALPWESGQ